MSQPVLRFVAIEGIGGSGKTTLARNLAEALRIRSFGAGVRVIDEFSSGSLGNFIRSRLSGGKDFRIHTLPSGPSHLDSLLAIADMAGRLQDAAASLPGTIGIFDGFKLSHIAHAQALLPQCTDSSVIEATSLAVDILCQQMLLLPGPVFTVLLDIPPEVVVARLENRVGRPANQAQRDFLKSLSNAFDELAADYNVNARIDATRSKVEVVQDAIKTLSPLLGL